MVRTIMFHRRSVYIGVVLLKTVFQAQQMVVKLQDLMDFLLRQVGQITLMVIIILAVTTGIK